MDFFKSHPNEKVSPDTKKSSFLSSSSSKVLNPHLFVYVMRLPQQKLSKLSLVEMRKETWRSKKWMERFSTDNDLELTKRERFHLYGDICRDTLWVMCCPPCSTISLANKFAFSAPRKANYWPLSPPENTGNPRDSTLVGTRDLASNVRVFWVTTKKRTRIACTFVESMQSSAPVILYNHSNADDIGTIIRHLRLMSRLLYCHIFAYDYSGYGLSEGEASIKNLYSDCEAAYLALRFYHGFNQDDIILYGSSLGSVAAAHLAAKYSCKGLIMMASIPSGVRLLCRGELPFGQREAFPFDVLDNITLAKKIRCPVLVVHGEDDQLCAIEGARFLAKQAPFPASPAFYKNVGHNEVELFRLATMRISHFIHSETFNIWVMIHEQNATRKTVTK